MARHRAAIRHITQCLLRQAGLRDCREGMRVFCAQATGPSGQEQGQPDGQETPPPSAASTMGLMAAGALGAVAIAGVGVYGVLQLSLMVAQGTGRSIMADKEKSEAERNARTQPPR